MFSPLSSAEEINVGFEPFPPLINEDGSGLVKDMLTGLLEQKKLRFNIKIMTYARAKNELKSGQLNLIGLTPYQLETEDFYQYARELNWHIQTRVDFFALKPRYFNIEKLPDGSIGTPIGNAAFFSEVTNVPIKKFVEVSSLKQAVKMLAQGRLNVILFERVSTMSTIRALNIENIYYKNMGNIPASLAVPNTNEGLMLKQQLDSLLDGVENQDYFTGFTDYTSMQTSGEVTLQ